ncbi:WD-40 repeat-containing protein [Calothrix sp. NIES-4071]|nr:WD-40 repeat-containing protein [Calothrix sp. NIES-4071]BAZ55254.1 WD-40 repeat-containing protein [Calothrix sp. NIES-4105]
MSEFSRNLAFIVGINNYTNGISPLHNAENDAKTIVEILRSQHGYEICVCLNELAALDNLTEVLEVTLLEQVTENDRLLFYFAGHGIALNGDDGPEGYLIPQDAKLGDTNTYLPMAKLQKCLEKLPCRHFLGILDCCFAGAFRWSSTRDLLTAPEVMHEERYDRFIADPAWQVITSAACDQKALDAFNFNARRQKGEHSPFAAALIEALAGKADIYPPSINGEFGDGVITATELYMYLRNAVEEATEECSQRQTPSIWPLKKHDKGEYIFLSPGHRLNLPKAPPLDVSKNPYRGLESFNEEHSKLFFGRDKLVEKLKIFVATHPLTIVLGASGSGKSSLVKAGLIPELRKETTQQWSILPPIRPGEAPLQALKNIQLPEVATHNPQQNLATSIDIWAKNHPNTKLLLFIDQSEEVIVLCRNENERKQFFQEILDAVNIHRHRLRVVLSLRCDFEPQIRDAVLQLAPKVLNIENTLLKKHWQSGRFIVPAMTRGGLREAIEKPAETRVMYFQPHELVEQLIDEVADMPGALPLLSFGLSELYLKYLKRQWDAQNRGITIDRALTQEDYQDLGGVIQSLTQRADEEYEALVQENSAYAQIIRHVMLRMVALGGGELARRQVLLSELEYPPQKNYFVKEVIERFTEARLLVKGEDVTGNFYVEPAHDALVRGWERLLSWVKDEKNLRLQRRLTPAVREWKSQQHEKFLWDDDPYLDVLDKDVLNSQNNWLNQKETEFVQRSLQKRKNNHRRLFGSVTGVIFALGAFAILAGYQWRNSEIQEIKALSETSTSLLLSHQELEAVITSLRTRKAFNSSFWQVVLPDSELDNQVRGTLQKVLYGVKEHNRLQVNSPIYAVSFSPNDQIIATVTGTVQLWKQDGSLIPWPHNGRQFLPTISNNNQKSFPIVASSADNQIVAIDYMGGLLLLFNTKDGAKPISISSVAFNPTKKIMALAAQDRVVLLSLAGDQPLTSLSGQRGSIAALAFNRDGKTLVTASTQENEKQQKIGTVQIWNVENGALLKNLEGDMNGVQQAVAISPDSKMVAASGWYGATVWKSDGSWHKKLEGHNGAVNSINFSPDGKKIATGGVDKIIKIWNIDGTLDKNIFGHSDAVWEVNFSPDSQMVVSASNDNKVKFWQTSDGTLLNTFAGHKDVVRAVTFSHDGKMIASASDDGTVKLWQLGGSSLKALSHNEQVYAVAFSPDRKTIVTTNGHGWVTFWNPDGTLRKTEKWHGGPITAVAFSRNGKMIATAAGDRGVQIRSSDGALEKFLEGHNGEINQSEVLGISFSPDSQKLVTANTDGTVQLFNSSDGKLLKTLDKQNSIVRGVSFSPNGQMIASTGNNGTVKLWNSNGIRNLSGHKKAVLGVAISPDSQTIASVSADQTVKLWNSNDGKLLKTLPHKDVVFKVAFSPNGQIIASASNDGTVKLWKRDGTFLKTLSGHEGALYTLAFSPDGKTIASVGSDQTVILWKWEENLDINQLQKYGCEWVGNYLKNNPNVDESARNLCSNVKK